MNETLVKVEGRNDYICSYIRNWMKKKSATQYCVYKFDCSDLRQRFMYVAGRQVRYTWGRNTRSMYQLIEINWLNHKTSCLQFNINVTYYSILIVEDWWKYMYDTDPIIENLILLTYWNLSWFFRLIMMYDKDQRK